MFPIGFHVDEAKVAWESLSILKTGKDDHGNLLPLYYNSFGDFRPTGIFYVTIPSLIVFGRSNFAVRFPSALIGALTVFPLYFIALEFEKRFRDIKENKHSSLGIAAGFILAIITWHLTTSRATSEVVISCFLILTSLSLVKKKTILAFVIFAVSFLFYHSARVIGPLFMLSWIVFIWKEIRNNRNLKKVIIGFFITSLLSLLLILSPTGLARYNQVKLSRPSVRDVVIDYSSYFDPNFFIGDIAKPFRYTVNGSGIVSIPIFILFLLGIYLINKSGKNKILFLFFALGPIPAALTLEDSPNLHRAFFILPFLVIIAGIGLKFLWEEHRNLFRVFIILMIYSFTVFAFGYLSTDKNSAFLYRDPQTKRLTSYILSERKNYDRIYITNDPDSPYPWFYFFSNYEPANVNKAFSKQVDGRWSYENIVWDNNRCPKAKVFEEADKEKLNKILVVENGMCTADLIKGHTQAKVTKEFDYSGQVNYRVWKYEPGKS